MNNLLHKSASPTTQKYLTRPLPQLLARLDALLLVLKSCKTTDCRRPWDTMFKKDQVNSIAEAMDLKYDEFFAKQPKVSFKTCKTGHVISNEGPQKPNVYLGS